MRLLPPPTVSLGLLMSLLAPLAAASQAQLTPAPASPGIDGGVTMPLSEIDVRIRDGVATTTLHQTIHNRGTRDAEAGWLVPLPEGAVADGFTMTVNGERMTGSVLDATQARGVYERIVRQRRDPGLLRYVGRGCLQANIFPVPPGGDVEVEVTFRHVLPEVGGLNLWSFPVAAAGLAGVAPDQVVLNLTVESSFAHLTNAFSPNARLHVVQTTENQALASLEGPGAGLEELQVFYGTDQTEFGLDLMSYVATGEEEGSFLLMISPRREWATEEIAKKEITFVVDVSGSMEGEKLTQAKGALLAFLTALNAGDHFNVIPFSTTADPFFPRPVEATAENVAQARHAISRLVAEGGTNISSALQAALERKPAEIDAAKDFVPITVFLTDGLPTLGHKDPDQLLPRIRGWNQRSARIFVLGVGNDVNAPLLDLMAAEGHGTRTYVRHGQSIELAASGLFQQLSHPVMTGLSLAVEGVQASKMSPDQLPDLFVGQRLAIVGRYAGQGPARVRLSGKVAGERRTYELIAQLASKPDARFDFVPSLWAERRLAVLLDAMRLGNQDPELYDEVVRLGSKYNIVTPYTSHLILEKGLELPAGTPVARGNTPGRPTSGGVRGGGTFRGPGDTVSPGSPAPSAPGSPAGGPATPGTRSGSSDWYLGSGGQGRSPGAEGTFDWLVERLLVIGVLPEGAPREELEALAREIAAELRDSSDSLGGLGKSDTGARAVDDSAYLARKISGAERGASAGKSGADAEAARQAALLELFTRRVGDRLFHLRAGFWTDETYDATDTTVAVREIEAYSDAYFALLTTSPGVAPYLALSERLVLVLEGEVVRITPPKPEAQETPPVPVGG